MARALNIVAILFVGFLLGAPHAAFAQGLDDANALAQRVDELTKKGQYTEAISLAQRVLAIREKTLDADDLDVAYALNKLANLYKDQGHYSDDEPLYKRSLATRQKVLGPDHPDVALSRPPAHRPRTPRTPVGKGSPRPAARNAWNGHGKGRAGAFRCG
jgi:tetratricopeptide (TPR) repeat protein